MTAPIVKPALVTAMYSILSVNVVDLHRATGWRMLDIRRIKESLPMDLIEAEIAEKLGVKLRTRSAA